MKSSLKAILSSLVFVLGLCLASFIVPVEIVFAQVLPNPITELNKYADNLKTRVKTLDAEYYAIKVTNPKSILDTPYASQYNTNLALYNRNPLEDNKSKAGNCRS